MKQLSRTQEKTRQAFIDAFFTVRSQKTENKITVKDIVTIAGYNRSSFYLYFTDILDLASAAEQELLHRLADATSIEPDTTITVSPEDTMIHFAQHTVEYADKIYTLSDSKSFQDGFMALLKPNFSRISGLHQNDKDYEYLVSLLFSIMLHNFRFWAKHKDDYSLEEITKISRNILLGGIKSTV